MKKIINLMLNHTILTAVILSMITTVSYYFGMQLMVAYKPVMIASVIGAVITMVFSVYSSVVLSRIPELKGYAKFNAFTVIITASTIATAMVAPQLILAYSVVVSIVITMLTMKYSMPALKTVYAD